MAALFDTLVPTQASAFRVQPRLQARLVHDIPGRLRVVLPALKGDPRRADAVHAHLDRLDAVRGVRVNTLTGSVLVEHDPDDAGRDAVLRALDEAGYRLVPQATPRVMHQAAHRPGTGGITAASPVRRAAEGAANAALDWLIERAVYGALAAVI